jgi:hypothetical protein
LVKLRRGLSTTYGERYRVRGGERVRVKGERRARPAFIRRERGRGEGAREERRSNGRPSTTIMAAISPIMGRGKWGRERKRWRRFPVQVEEGTRLGGTRWLGQVVGRRHDAVRAAAASREGDEGALTGGPHTSMREGGGDRGARLGL